MLLISELLETPCWEARLLRVVPDCKSWSNWLVLRPSSCAVLVSRDAHSPPW